MFAMGTSSAENLSQCCHARATRLIAEAGRELVANVRICQRATSPRTITDIAKAHGSAPSDGDSEFTFDASVIFTYAPNGQIF